MSEPEKQITIDPDKALSKRFALRRAVPGMKTLEASVPYEPVEREARQKGLTVEQFLASHEVEWLYDGFTGLLARFVPKA